MHTTPIEVRFADCDSFRHVNNAVYLTYAEQARIHFFDDKLGTSIDWKAKGLILARIDANYIEPVLLHDKIEVTTECTKIGTKSITLQYRVFKISEDSRKEMCNGETILVAYDYIKNESMLVPDDWKKLISI